MTQEQIFRALLSDIYSILIPFEDSDPRFWPAIALGFGYTGEDAISFGEAVKGMVCPPVPPTPPLAFFALANGTDFLADGIEHADAITIQNTFTLSFLELLDLKTVATGLTITGTALSTVSLPSLTSVANQLYIAVSNPNLTTISIPLLTHIAGPWVYYSNIALTDVDLPLLETVDGGIAADHNTVLVEIYYPSLVTVNDNISYAFCALLADVSFPLLLPTNGFGLDFSQCALTEASVDHLLARCIANPAYVSGNVDLSGGTSAPPSVTGAADKATLIGRGVTVTTN